MGGGLVILSRGSGVCIAHVPSSPQRTLRKKHRRALLCVMCHKYSFLFLQLFFFEVAMRGFTLTSVPAHRLVTLMLILDDYAPN